MNYPLPVSVVRKSRSLLFIHLCVIRCTVADTESFVYIQTATGSISEVIVEFSKLREFYNLNSWVLVESLEIASPLPF